MKLIFKRLVNKWFCDVENWEGAIEELEMVMGAELFLDKIPYKLHKDIREIEISIDDSTNANATLSLYSIGGQDENYPFDSGAFYYVDSEEFQSDIWICDVTKFVLGEFPSKIYVKYLN